MSLADLQFALMRLYTDVGFRTAFRVDKTHALGGLQLSAGDHDVLDSVDPAEVEEFAESLRAKRSGLLERVLPGTVGQLGSSGPVLTDRFLDLHPYRAGQDSTDVAAEFAGYLRECVSFYPGLPAALADLAAFEQLLARARREFRWRRQTGAAEPGAVRPGPDSVVWRPGATAVGRYRHDVVGLLTGDRRLDDPGGPTDVVVSASPAAEEPVVLVVAPDVVTIVEALGVPVTVRRLAATLSGSGDLRSERTVTAVVEDLVAAGVITVVRESGPVDALG